MKMEYGSFAYCFSLILAIALLAAMGYLFRNRSPRVQKAALLLITAANVLQHLFKSALYPHLYGTGFSLVNTAYNVCAFLILASPVVLLCGSNLMRVFVSYAGAIGSLLALAMPFWFMGQTVWQWEYLRFYVCHVLLLLSSALPILWKLYRPSYRDFWKTGFLFLGMLGAIMINNVLFFVCDPARDPQDLFSFLQTQNPLWSMHPTDTYPALSRLFTALTPELFLPSAAHPYYTPVLWYALPVYLAVTALSLLLFLCADGKRFINDFRKSLAQKRTERLKKHG